MSILQTLTYIWCIIATVKYKNKSRIENMPKVGRRVCDVTMNETDIYQSTEVHLKIINITLIVCKKILNDTDIYQSIKIKLEIMKPVHIVVYTYSYQC